MNLAFGDYELDLDLHELRHLGQPIHVEPQVFDLLVYFAEHRERIVSKDELIAAIWGGRAISEAALSSRILAARKALGDTGAEQVYIKTVHKRGFRFTAEVRAVSGASRAAPEAPAQPEPAALDGVLGPASVALAPSSTNVPVASTGRPAIAVLPFVDLSRDPEQDYFAYGITEDIIRLLARNRWLTVIGRHSTMVYRGQTVDMREVGEALGVRYIVHGTVRRSGDHGRIGADLVEAASGASLWAERYDFDLTDVFDVQEDLAQKIAATIEPELSVLEQRSAARKPPESLDAWDCYQRGLWHFWAFTTPGFDEAEYWYRRAIAIEPTLARAYAGIAYVNVQRAFYDSGARAASLERALEAALTGVSLDERDCVCHCVLGRVYTLRQEYEDAIAWLNKAIDANPSFAQAYFALGFALIWTGRQEEAIALFDRAAQLSPRDPHLWTFYSTRAMAHLSLGELDEAEIFARRALRQPNVTYWPVALTTSCLGLLGKVEEGRAMAAELLRRKPDYSCEHGRNDLFFCRDQGFIERFVSGLRVSGLPG